MVADRNSAGRRGGEGGRGLPFASDGEGEINDGEEGKGRKQRTRRGGEGALEDCAPLARCSARGGLLPLEPAAEGGGGKSGGGGRGGEGRGRHHVVNHGPVAPMYYIFPA